MNLDVSVSISLAWLLQSQIPLSSVFLSLLLKELSPRGPSVEAAMIWAACPIVETPCFESPGPVVRALHAGLEQRYATLCAIACFIFCVKSASLLGY